MTNIFHCFGIEVASANCSRTVNKINHLNTTAKNQAFVEKVRENWGKQLLTIQFLEYCYALER